MEFILDLIVQYPTVGSIVAALGAVRLVFKPLMTAIDSYVLSTETKDDDIYVEGIKATKWFRVVVFVLDWAFSVKIPK